MRLWSLSLSVLAIKAFDRVRSVNKFTNRRIIHEVDVDFGPVNPPEAITTGYFLAVIVLLGATFFQMFGDIVEIELAGTVISKVQKILSKNFKQFKIPARTNALDNVVAIEKRVSGI